MKRKVIFGKRNSRLKYRIFAAAISKVLSYPFRLFHLVLSKATKVITLTRLPVYLRYSSVDIRKYLPEKVKLFTRNSKLRLQMDYLLSFFLF